MVKQIFDVQVTHMNNFQAFDISGGELSSVASVAGEVQNEKDFLICDAEIFEDLGELFSFGFFEIVEVLDDDEIFSLGGQSRFESKHSHFLIHRDGVVSRLGTESHTTTGPEGRTDGTCSSATGAFLAPGLATTAGNFRPGLGVGTAGSGIGQLSDESGMDYAYIRLDGKDFFTEVYFTQLLAFQIYYLRGCHFLSLLFDQTN